MLDIDLAFPHSYKVEELPELPGDGKFSVPVRYFPQPKTRPEHDGLWLKIQSVSGSPWIGVFKFGYVEPLAFSRVLSCPDPDRVCIISRGAAYIVKADQPEVWEQLPISPVLDARLVTDEQLLLFSDFTSLAAYGTSGLAGEVRGSAGTN